MLIGRKIGLILVLLLGKILQLMKGMDTGYKFTQREQILLIIFFIIIAFLFFFCAEVLMPFKTSLQFDIITEGQRIFRERKQWQEINEQYHKLKQKIKTQEEKLATLQLQRVPANNEETNFYAVVDLFNNLLLLKKDDLVFNQFKVSTGKGDTLIAPWGKKWIFETPTGVFRILRKIKNPVWYKPDWAFLEAKESIPGPDSPKRLVRGILGDYALDLGGGIMLHGTPYEKLLGQRVSHGCIRLPKDGIKLLYDSLPLGAKVYIFGK